jgi:hypothetical protein
LRGSREFGVGSWKLEERSGKRENWKVAKFEVEYKVRWSGLGIKTKKTLKGSICE